MSNKEIKKLHALTHAVFNIVFSFVRPTISVPLGPDVPREPMPKPNPILLCGNRAMSQGTCEELCALLIFFFSVVCSV